MELMQIFFYTVAILTSSLIFTVFGWGICCIAVEFFRHRDHDGIGYYDGGEKYDMSSWFDPISAEDFYKPFGMVPSTC